MRFACGFEGLIEEAMELSLVVGRNKVRFGLF